MPNLDDLHRIELDIPKRYTPPKHSLGESLPKRAPTKMDCLMERKIPEHAAFGAYRMAEALREARALLEKITSAGYLGEPDDRMLPHVAASLTLLEKWRGEA